MDKITLLWIEDLPLQNSVEKKINSTKVRIPSLRSPYKEYFDLKLLQHPEEIKEYLKMMDITFNKKGIKVFESQLNLIPDITIFDYKLSDNFDRAKGVSYNNDKTWETVRKILNPCYEIKELHDDLFGQYSLFPESPYENNQFHLAINNNLILSDSELNQEKSKLSNDELGLYSGIIVLRYFKDHITCGIPATFNKNELEKLHPTAKYFEWLNRFDLEDALEREKKSSKDWNDVIGDGVKLLRKRILSQIINNKITVDLNNLIKLLGIFNNNSVSSQLDKEGFVFTSAYGTKKIPMQGLFIDFTDMSKKDKLKAIKDDFLDKILEHLEANLTEVKRAIEISDLLWKTYTNPNEFENRMELSDLHFRISKKIKLNTKEAIRYKNHLKQFGGEISKEIAADKCITIENFYSETKSTLRLAIGHLVAKLFITYQNSYLKYGNRQTYFPPDEIEVYNILNPVKNTEIDRGLILPLHLSNEKNPKNDKWFHTDIFDTFGRKINKHTDLPRAKWYEMNWLSEGEKKIIHSFFFNEREFYPKWLK